MAYIIVREKYDLIERKKLISINYALFSKSIETGIKSIFTLYYNKLIFLKNENERVLSRRSYSGSISLCSSKDKKSHIC